jgi:N-acylneuraminate cytidylyltransferase/CMP-N,N'-diacetyllegionaminic acid synthase
MKKKVLCIIPARKGSKGLRNKNIKKLNKIPLIAWSILTAKKCKLIDEIIVSTDCPKISKIAVKYGAKVPFIRPKKFATDKSSSFSVLKHAIDFFKKKKTLFDYILMLEPTSPLRDSKDIDFCINKLKKNNIETLVSVTRVVDQHPYFLYSISKKNILKPYVKKQKKLYIRRQDVSPLYYLEGSIYISKTKTLLKEKTWYHKKTQAFEVEKRKSLEIDDIDDFKLAEFYLKN